jgi:two-component system chemotaxis response regulator CheY
MSRALVIDDDDSARTVLKIHLNELMECDVAACGSEAVAMVEKACQSGTPYTLICLDIMMPEMHGHAVLAEIRQIEAAMDAAEPARIIMVTAMGDMANVAVATSSGCDAYLVKPYTKNQLMERLKTLGLISQEE